MLPDGSGLLVADWNYNGWRNANTDAGRLLKLTYTGKLNPTARPKWWVAAAQGQKFEATTAELIAALGYDVYQVAYMFACLGMAIGVYGSFVIDVIVSICDYLDIWCLTIKHPYDPAKEAKKGQ